jgi:phosphopantetheinyl transferase (holo-ACP synthase)
VRHIRFFSDPPAPGKLLKCRVRISDIDDHCVRADIKMTANDGRQWVSVQGWTHRRFALPLEFYHFCRFPKANIIGQPVAEKDRSRSGALTCRQSKYPELNRTIWKQGLGMIFLSRAERRIYKEKLSRDEAEADRWLSERMTAKEAVRLFLKQHNRPEVFPADIEFEEIDGRLIPKGDCLSDLNRPLSLTISHTEQFAAAHVNPGAETIKRERAQND